METSVAIKFCVGLGMALTFGKLVKVEKGSHSSASEATLMALLSARTREIQRYREHHPDTEAGVIMAKFVAYTSDQAHSSVEKAGMIAGIKTRMLLSDDHFSLRGHTLAEAVQRDRAQGLIPIFVCATLGTTASCSFDNIQELGPICEREGMWMHIDAAYAGNALICAEFRPLMDGIEHAESFNFNASKWMKVNFACSPMWVKHKSLVTEAFQVNRLLLQHNEECSIAPEFRHWHVALGHRFVSFKLWFTLRLYGQKALQENIREHVRLAHDFETMVLHDNRFEIVGTVTLGLVCFRLKGNNERTEKLLQAIHSDRRIYLLPGAIRGVYFLRMVISLRSKTTADVEYSWSVIREVADTIVA